MAYAAEGVGGGARISHADISATRGQRAGFLKYVSLHYSKRNRYFLTVDRHFLTANSPIPAAYLKKRK